MERQHQKGLRECVLSLTAKGAGLQLWQPQCASQTAQASGSSGGGGGRLLQGQPFWELGTSSCPSPTLCRQAGNTPPLGLSGQTKS